MNTQDAFARVLASLYDAMLDETRRPAASALIDEACGLTGNGLMVGEGPKDDERVSRFRQLPARRLVHVTDLYTAEELKTSPTYNELLPRAGMQDSLNVRLPGLDGSHIGWGLNDPVDAEGWGSSRIAMVQGLFPHIQQFVRVRQALGRWTGTECCPPARRPIRSVSNGWWATRCRPRARSRSVGRWCSAARPWCRRSWCPSSRWASRTRTCSGSLNEIQAGGVNRLLRTSSPISNCIRSSPTTNGPS